MQPPATSGSYLRCRTVACSREVCGDCCSNMFHVTASQSHYSGRVVKQTCAAVSTKATPPRTAGATPRLRIHAPPSHSKSSLTRFASPITLSPHSVPMPSPRRPKQPTAHVDVSFKRILRFQKTEYPLLAGGVVMAMGNGAVMPVRSLYQRKVVRAVACPSDRDCVVWVFVRAVVFGCSC